MYRFTALGPAGGALIAFMLAGLMASSAVAATNTVLPIQGAFRTASGGVAPDGKYVFFVHLYATKTAKTPVWKEAIAGVEVKSGVFSIAAGASTTKLPVALFAKGGPLWIGIKVDSDPELPRAPVRPVPFAVHALVATTADNAKSAQTATVANNAKTADSAKTALTANKAKTADSAAVANSAAKAKSADIAASSLATKSLACTGCVRPEHLHGSVAQAYVPVSGGSIKGTLAINGKLELGASTISGGRIAAVDLAKTPCNAKALGAVVLDAKTSRLYLCNGTGWQRLMTCNDACPDMSKIACGTSFKNGCGENCAGTGTLCSNGGKCIGGKCAGSGSSQATAARTCEELKGNYPKTPSGPYWLDPDGGSKSNAVRLYCDMTTDGGGWTLVHKTNRANTCDRTDSGCNTGALSSASVNTVAILPRSIMAKIGTTIRVESTDGKKMFWQGSAYYTTDKHSSGALQSKLSWAAGWAKGTRANHSKHGICVGLAAGFGKEHICTDRWCCGGSGAGIWFNGGAWKAGYYNGRGWAK